MYTQQMEIREDSRKTRTKAVFERARSTSNIGPFHSHECSIASNWSGEAPYVTFEWTLYVINFFLVDPIRSSNVLLSHFFSFSFSWRLLLRQSFLSFSFLPKRYGIRFVCGYCSRINLYAHRTSDQLDAIVDLSPLFSSHIRLLDRRSPRCLLDEVGNKTNGDVSQRSAICSTFGCQQINKLYFLLCAPFRDKFSCIVDCLHPIFSPLFGALSHKLYHF